MNKLFKMMYSKIYFGQDIKGAENSDKKEKKERNEKKKNASQIIFLKHIK